MKDIDTICKLLKKTRLEKGFTLRDVEKRCGISFSTVSLIENRRHAFSLENLMKLAEAYEVPVSYFFHEAERVTAHRQTEGWMSATKWEESFKGAAGEGVQEELLNPPSQHKKVKVTLVRMESNSEVSWQQPTSGTLYLYLVSGRVRILRDDAEALTLDENGFCNYELNSRARVQSLSKSCLYLTRVRD
ncbi:MAG TPA: helix-turn-helix transcriptional regulator [Planctomycetota bacterium]|nr:helix-turn-helix transcriptional regulator [Planctomycetota bacterium]